MFRYLISRIYTSYKCRRHIKRTDIILDVGSGPNRPFFRADILLDIVPRSYQRDSRPFIQADVCHLPFHDKSIDYINCNHVLEHVTDVEKALNELQRVSHRGYISTPTALCEALFAENSMHKWLVELDEGKLVFTPKDEAFFSYQERFGALAQQVARCAPKAWTRLYQETFPFRSISYEWIESIPFEINGGAQVQPVGSSFWQGYPHQKSLVDDLFGAAWALVNQYSKLERRERAKRIDLSHLLRCTVCKGKVRQISAGIQCQSCGAEFPIEEGIIHMLPEQARK